MKISLIQREIQSERLAFAMWYVNYFERCLRVFRAKTTHWNVNCLSSRTILPFFNFSSIRNLSLVSSSGASDSLGRSDMSTNRHKLSWMGRNGLGTSKRCKVQVCSMRQQIVQCQIVGSLEMADNGINIKWGWVLFFRSSAGLFALTFGKRRSLSISRSDAAYPSESASNRNWLKSETAACLLRVIAVVALYWRTPKPNKTV